MALAHDALFVIATFAIVRVFGIAFEIDQVFVAAILTVIGYSINDTVIIFDRIREYLGMGTSHDRAKIFNDAINSTLNRTIITSGTVLLVVIALLFFGGEVLRGFSFALLVGVGIGTYSSIFMAAPIVLDFDKEKAKRLKMNEESSCLRKSLEFYRIQKVLFTQPFLFDHKIKDAILAPDQNMKRMFKMIVVWDDKICLMF